MLNRCGAIILFFLILPIVSFAQVNSYFVSFKDKAGTPYSIENPTEFLTQRSIDRRLRQNIAVTEEDLPVSPDYLIDLENSGAVSVRYTSKWLNGAIIQATKTDAESIKFLPFVAEIEYIAPANVGGRGSGKDKLESEEIPLSDSLQQFELLGIREMRSDGFQGEGLHVTIIDGGFEGVDTLAAFKHLFNDNRIAATYDFIASSENVFRYSNHGTEVLSLMAASQALPEYEGVVPEASYLLFVTENAAADVEYRIEEYWWLIAAEKADSLGTDVINTSLGYYSFLDGSMNYSSEELDGRTAIISRAAALAAARGILFITSAGNTGNKAWMKVTFPGDIGDGIAVGSLINEGTVSGFSPFGPSSDGRVKPDLMAIGSGATVVTSDGRLVAKSGTSFASPLVAGLLTGIWQAYPTLSAKGLIEAARMSASYAYSPNNRWGYGIPSYQAIVNYLEHLENSSMVELYPNPTESEVVIKVNDPSVDYDVDLKLFNSEGKILNLSNLDITWQDNKYILDVSTLPRGIYVLNLQSNTRYSKLKFIKL